MTIRIVVHRSIVTMLAAVGVALVFFGAAHSASAQSDSSAEAFLSSIYSAYKGSSDRGRGVPLDSDTTIQRYFEPSLAAEIIKDAAEAKKRGEVPKLSRDPFIDGQDWEIPRFTIAVKEGGPDKVVGTVTINNFGKDIPLILDLVKRPDDWRIANIIWERGDTLRGLYFKGEPQPPAIKKPAKATKKHPSKAAKKPPRREKRP